jgi:hypothetical protein
MHFLLHQDNALRHSKFTSWAVGMMQRSYSSDIRAHLDDCLTESVSRPLMNFGVLNDNLIE